MNASDSEGFVLNQHNQNNAAMVPVQGRRPSWVCYRNSALLLKKPANIAFSFRTAVDGDANV